MNVITLNSKIIFMKLFFNVFSSVLFLFVFNSLLACKSEEVVIPIPKPQIIENEKDTVVKVEKWKLTFSDEFNESGAPDETKWERQEYNRRNNSNGPDGWWSKEDSYLENGNLVIRVRTIPNKNTDNDLNDYSVGALRTKGKFEQKYGKFEIRCKLPDKQGWWVAFWMMQGNVNSIDNQGIDGSEVDIMEAFGWGDKINQAIHWNGYGTEHKSVEKALMIPGVSDGFHTYTMEWYPEVYKFFIDGVETWSSTGGGVCNQPGYIKITGEISTEAWAIVNYWSREPNPESFPDYFLVDWVRVYSEN